MPDKAFMLPVKPVLLGLQNQLLVAEIFAAML
jgi:hypothetical protein